MPLVDYLGNEIPVKKPESGRAGAVPVAQRPSLWTGSFTEPSQLKAAWASARRGDIRTLMQIGAEIENDPRLLGLVRTRRLAVSRLQWRVEPALPDDEAAKKMADEVTAMLGRMKLRQALLHLQDAVIKPLAVLEIVWQNVGKRTEVAALIPRLGTEFTFDFQSSGEQVRLITEAAQPLGQPVDPLKFVIRFSSEKGLAPLAEGGLVKGLAGRWLIASHLLINWSVFCELYGIPWRIGKYDAGMPDEDIRKLKLAVQGLGADAGAVISRDMEIQIIESQKNSGRDVFSVFIDVLYKDLAIGILGQVLTSSGSDQGSGSLALGEVHNEVRQELVEADAAAISEIVTEQLIVPYCLFNFGEQAGYPRFELISSPAEDLAKRLEMDERLQRMGFPFSLEDMAEQYGRQIPGEEETLLEAPNPNLPFTNPSLAASFKKKSLRMK